MIKYKEFAEAVKNVIRENIDYGIGGEFVIDRESEELKIIEEYLEEYFPIFSTEMLVGYIFGINAMVDIQENKLKGGKRWLSLII